MKKWREIWAGMVCVTAVFLVGLVGFTPAVGKEMDGKPGTDGYEPNILRVPQRAVHGGTAAVGPEPDGAAAKTAEFSLPSTLKVVFGEEVREMGLEEYVYGVVAAEMPAAFPEAALEAQAVAARTYALYQRAAGKHSDAGGDVCGESTCCQAFITQDELDARWGSDAAFYTAKMHGAVEKTAGEILTYGGEPAAAVYHASSDGSTRSAAEVWGGSQPYLVAVDTPEDTGSKGHGVGMSQRGAQALALEGAGYREILEHYYQGTEVVAAR